MTKRLIISLLTLLCCCTGAWAEGELNGLFTINASGDKVQFSKGNLQYVDENYQFAEHQYDYFGGNQYSNHVDMFANNGYSSPDGDTAWRILSQSEWSYLYTERSVTNTLSEGARYSKATIGGTYKGVIVFPDSYTHPNGTGFAGNCNNAAENYASTVSLEGWALMEAAGCVFLPAAGYKNDNIRKVDDASVYDSSTANDDRSRCTPGFYSNEIKLDDRSYNTTCVPVRLVKDYTLQQDGEGNYLLGSAYDWKLFATLVNSGTNPAANAKMTADIDLGDDQTHIGSLAEGANPKYAGVFDGQGHTLTVNYVGGSNQIVAPFTQTNSATIKNLHIAGSIQSSFAYIGVVGIAGGSSVISKVWMSATMNTTQDGWVQSAAIAGYCEGSIQDCLFTGTFTSGSSGYMGGFYGYTNGSPTITNCLSTGTFNNGNWQGSGIHTNCYLKQYPADLTTGCSWATNETLSDGTIATALQNGRAEEVWVQDPLTNQPMLALFAGKYTVPASGLGTFSAKANFTLPEGLEAYYCKNYDATEGAIGVTAIEGVVPAEIGVLLRGEPGETYTLTISDDTPATVTDNALVAVTTQTKIDQTSGDYTNFGLSNGTFKKVNSAGGTVKANRAYLHILTSELSGFLARGIKLVWNGDVTNIQEVQGSTFEVQGDNSWYTLSGLRLNGKPTTKGIYIVNGKKIFIN